jgi:phage shock protein A
VADKRAEKIAELEDEVREGEELLARFRDSETKLKAQLAALGAQLHEALQVKANLEYQLRWRIAVPPADGKVRA